MSEMPRADNFQQAIQTTTEISTERTPPATRGRLKRIALVLALLVIMMIPLYWIGSTAFKPRAAATTVPPTVFFKPEITAFIKLFTSRVERRGAPNKEEYAKAPWWEKLVMDGGERFIRDDKGNIVSSGYVGRFTNSLIIAVTSTFLAVAMVFESFSHVSLI